MEGHFIQIVDENGKVIYQLRYKRSKHQLTEKDQEEILKLLQCIQAAGYSICHSVVQPQGCLFSPEDMRKDIAIMLQRHDDWEMVVSAKELFSGLSRREKQLLELLALNNNREVESITGLKFNYLKSVRKRINSKTRCNSPAMLRAFYYSLLEAGVIFPPWKSTMRKKTGSVSISKQLRH
jgi:hypothetical protein